MISPSPDDENAYGIDMLAALEAAAALLADVGTTSLEYYGCDPEELLASDDEPLE